MVTSDPATGPGDATVPWAAEPLDARNTEFRKRVSSNNRPDAWAVFVFSAPDACQEKEHASVDQTNAANLAIATLNLPVFNSFPYLITRLAPAQHMRERQPDRPWITWSTELRNKAGASKMTRWLNTPDEEQQLAEVERELSVRQEVK